MPEAPRRAPGGLIRTGVLRRLLLAVAVGSLLLAIPPVTSAAGSVSLTTPYPAVAVPPGEKVSFKISVQTDVSDRVDLSVADVPEGWIASLRGEGFVVDGVQTTGSKPVELTLELLHERVDLHHEREHADQDGTEDRAEPRVHAADDHHDEQVDRLHPAELGRRLVDEEREHPARLQLP